jgi:lipoprotein-anchoring transpeptidase ErfK/SrfK
LQGYTQGVRRSGSALAGLLVCAAAGVVLAFATAGGVGAQGPPTGTTTAAPSALIPPGVTIGGVAVGGMSPETAAGIVQERFDWGLPLVYNGRARLAPSPYVLGATARVAQAVERARAAQPGQEVGLTVLINGKTTRAYVAAVASRFNRTARDAVLALRRGRPRIVPERLGITVQRAQLTAAIHRRLLANSRAAVVIKTSRSKPEVTARAFRATIVIHRGSNRLELFHYQRLRKRFRVATGERVYPTPLGRFRVVVKWRNPWWYPPNSRWAQGLKPVPPGPNNPLGTRWMGLSVPGVGIHGTPNPGSIGYSVSHGCIRMYIPDAEWLFNTIDIGTPVFIVPD